MVTDRKAVKIAVMNVRLASALFALGLLTAGAPTLAAPEPSCFARALPAGMRDTRLDDLKILLGWAFDVAAAHRMLAAGEEIVPSSGLSEVPGFGGATDLSALQGRYRVMRPPFDDGAGYYGIEIASLGGNGEADGLYLLNRFDRVSLAAALRDSLASMPSRCDALASPP